MLRLSRMTDFGVVVLSRMALARESLSTTASLAETTGLPMPSVSKVLKLLTRAQIVTSHRGVNGGYSLARLAEDITVEEIITALEGPVALTSCVDGTKGNCGVEMLCPLNGRWDKVNAAIRDALDAITLAAIADPPMGLNIFAATRSGKTLQAERTNN